MCMIILYFLGNKNKIVGEVELFNFNFFFYEIEQENESRSNLGLVSNKRKLLLTQGR